MLAVMKNTSNIAFVTGVPAEVDLYKGSDDPMLNKSR